MRSALYAFIEVGVAGIAFASASLFCAWRQARRAVGNPFVTRDGSATCTALLINRTEVGLGFPPLISHGDVDLRAGGVTVYKMKDQPKHEPRPWAPTRRR